MSMIIRDALAFGYFALSAASLSPRLDAELLLAKALEANKTTLVAHPEILLSARQEKIYKTFIGRAGKQEPIAYILGTKEFFGLSFFVDKQVLIPRPETEIITEHALSLAKKLAHYGKCSLIDIGTGSGCIIISLAKNLPPEKYSFYGIDVSRGALRCARRNARAHGMHTHISFMQSGLLKTAGGVKFEKNNIIVANLPYISNEKYKKLPPHIKRFEPKSSLLSKNHGLAHYKNLLEQMKTSKICANKTAHVFMEMEPEQIPKLAAHSASLFAHHEIKKIKDLKKTERVLYLKTHV